MSQTDKGTIEDFMAGTPAVIINRHNKTGHRKGPSPNYGTLLQNGIT